MVCSGEFVSFLEFVQSLAIKAIRAEHKISLQKIRDAVRVAQDEYHVEYPLARRHTTYLWGSEILIQVEQDRDPIQVTGKHKRQMTMKKIVEIYLADLSWDAEGLASEYRPFDIGILLSPKKRFGEPIVESCGMSAIALWEAVQTEGSIQAAAEAYGVEQSDVRVASHYFDILEGRPAK